MMSALARHAVHPPRVDGDSTRRESHPQNSLASSDTRWFETLGTFAAAYGTFLLTGTTRNSRVWADRFPRRRLPLVTTFRDALWRLLWTDASPDGDDVKPRRCSRTSPRRARWRARSRSCTTATDACGSSRPNSSTRRNSRGRRWKHRVGGRVPLRGKLRDGRVWRAKTKAGRTRA